ncbi:MAG: glycosyltransferase [Lachnospiraceae bacterium]|nr:glycosyltransferase [Lachnospiraceae bacterium]
MNKNPKISVIIPVFNGADYIGEAITSILQQTYKNYEIIVVNDGSDDNGKTRDIVKAFGNNIRYFEKENGGVSSALNMGIRHMSGEYFTWLSCDDFFCQTKFYDQISAVIASGKEDTIVQGNYFLCNEDFTKSIATNFENYYSIEQICRSIFLLLWGEVHFSSFLFHKRHFDRIGLFDETLHYAQDNDFIFRLCRKQKTAFVQKPVSKVRLHNKSGTNCFHGDVDKENRKVYLKIAESFSKEEIQEIIHNETKFYIKISGIIHSMNGETELEELKKKVSVCDRMILDNTTKIMNQKEWIIFGAGQYGRRLKFELDKRGIKVSCFIDNAEEKNGKIIDAIPCYKVEYLKTHPQAAVIVAQKFYAPAVEQLLAMKVEQILLKEEIDAILLG